MNPMIEAFFDAVTGTISYVVFDRTGGHAVIIDSVLDYDPKSGRTSTVSAEQLVAFVAAKQLQVMWILDTHAHADHLSAAYWLKGRLGGQIGIGERICDVQTVFKSLFNLGDDFATDGSQFDVLLQHGQTLVFGDLTCEVIAVPGHTPADVAFRIGDAVFVGDTLFLPDVGSARCDFPGGDVHALYESVQQLLEMSPSTRLFMCHDYPPESREPSWMCTVADQRAANIHLHAGVTEAAFTTMRKARDSTLAMPVLMLPAIQINLRAGRFPAPEANGVSYLKIPLNVL